MEVSSRTQQLELEVYKLLEKANLLQYYETFIAQGGDDITQLCYSTKEEFEEILSLVGMKSKPLHIRRLQKALIEWKSSQKSSSTSSTSDVLAIQYNSSSGLDLINSRHSPIDHNSTSSLSCFPKDNNFMQLKIYKQHSGAAGVPVSMLPNAKLSDEQAECIKSAVLAFVPSLPQYPAKELSCKNMCSKAIEKCLLMSDDDPQKLIEIRKLSAIYGRFDAPRVSKKPMSLHEVAVNEAAYQLTVQMPNLLTRRDDLFGFARQTVRLSGIQHQAGHGNAAGSGQKMSKMKNLYKQSPCSNTNISMDFADSTQESPASKIAKLENSSNNNSNCTITDPDKLTLQEQIALGNETLRELDKYQDSVRAQQKLHEHNPYLVADLQRNLDSTTIQREFLVQEIERLLASLDDKSQTSSNMSDTESSPLTTKVEDNYEINTSIYPNSCSTQPTSNSNQIDSTICNNGNMLLMNQSVNNNSINHNSNNIKTQDVPDWFNHSQNNNINNFNNNNNSSSVECSSNQLIMSNNSDNASVHSVSNNATTPLLIHTQHLLDGHGSATTSAYNNGNNSNMMQQSAPSENLCTFKIYDKYSSYSNYKL